MRKRDVPGRRGSIVWKLEEVKKGGEMKMRLLNVVVKRGGLCPSERLMARWVRSGNK